MMLTTSLLRRVSGVCGRHQVRRLRAAGGAAIAMGWVMGPAAGSSRSRSRTAAPSAPCGPSGGGFEDITEATHGVDHRFPSGIDLLAQVGNVQLHDIGLTAEIVVPDPV